MNKCTCSICRCEVDKSAASILTVSGVGNPRYLCPECDALFDEATRAEEFSRIDEAIAGIGAKMVENDVEDELVINEVSAILASAGERAVKIKEGTYDYSLDEVSEDVSEEDFLPVPDEPEETEEERIAREKKEKISKIVDIVTTSICIGAIVGAIIVLIVRLI